MAVSLLAGSIYSYSIVWDSLSSTTARMLLVPLGLCAAGLWWSERRGTARGRGLGGVVLLAAAALLAISVGEMYVAEFVMDPHWTLTQQWYASLSAGAACLCVGIDLVAGANRLRAPISLLSRLPRVTLGVYCIHAIFLWYVPVLERAEREATSWALVAGSLALVGSAIAAALAARSRVLRRLVG